MSAPSNISIVRIVSVLVGCVAVLWGAFIVRHILLLAFIAFFFAVGLEPLVQQILGVKFRRGKTKAGLRRKKPRGQGFSRAQAVAVVVVGVLFFVGMFLASLLPTLVSETERLVSEAPGYARELTQRSDTFKELNDTLNITEKLEDLRRDLPNILQRSATTALEILSSIVGAMFNLLTVVVFTIYFMLDLPALLAGVEKLMPATKRERFDELSLVVRERISGYLVGQLTVSLVASGVGLAVLLVLGVPFALPLAMWIAFSALIPMVGSTLGAVPAIIVAFFFDVPKGIGLLIFFVFYQQAENYWIAPRVMRRAVNVSAAGVLISALIGGSLLGIPGALLAIPVAASIKAIAHEVWIPRQDKA